MGAFPAEQCLLRLIMAFGCALVAWFSIKLKKSLKPVFLLKSEIQCLPIFLVQIPIAIVGCAGDWMAQSPSCPGFSLSWVSSGISLMVWEMSIKALEPAVVFQHLQAMGSVFKLCSRLARPSNQPVWYAFVFGGDPNSPLSCSHELFNSSDQPWPSVT